MHTKISWDGGENWHTVLSARFECDANQCRQEEMTKFVLCKGEIEYGNKKVKN